MTFFTVPAGRRLAACALALGAMLSRAEPPAARTPAAPPISLTPAQTRNLPAASPAHEAENPDLRAGDTAFAARDYPVAVSFYRKYLAEAEKRRDRSAVREAYERLLDALVLSKLPDQAEARLARYKKQFPGVNPTAIAMWQGDILFQRGKYQEADAVYRKLLDSLPVQDPRRMRTLFTCGMTLEKLGKEEEAAKLFGRLWEQAGGTPLGKRGFEHLILCLASGRQTDRALELLLENPPATGEADRRDYPLLASYIALKRKGAGPSSGAWNHLLSILPNGRDPLVFLVASSYGDAFAAAKDYPNALRSYRAAFQAASERGEMFETLNRMIAVIDGAGNKEQAARLALSQLDLFKGPLQQPAVKLRTARLLRDAGEFQGALELYESVFADVNAEASERDQAIREYTLLLGRTGDPAKAEKAVRAYFRPDRGAEGEFLLGEMWVRLKKPERYISCYEALAKRYPDQAVRAWKLAAGACLDAGLPGKAMMFLDHLRRVPGADDAALLYLEAAAHAQQHEPDAALRLYQKFLAKAKSGDPLIPQALYHSGLLAFSRQDMALAAARFSRLRKEFSGHKLAPQASAWLIQAYTVLRRDIAAERETWLLAEQHPDSEYAMDALFRLAAHYGEEGAEEKASALLKRLAADIRFPRIQAQAVYELATLAFQRGDSAGALRHLARLYENFSGAPVLDKTCSSVVSILAEAYYLNGDILRAGTDFQEALGFYRKALAVRGDSPLGAAAHGSIGDCLLALAACDPGNSKKLAAEALKSYQALLERPSGCPAPYEAMGLYRSGRCLELLEHEEEAAEQYRKVLYRFPASEAAVHPVETTWCVRAAEALISIAEKHPLYMTLVHARVALHWLGDARLIPMREAAARFEKLKNKKFNP